jgi:hypothetical protein
MKKEKAMGKFKVGDTVRCVDNYLNSKHLTIGQEYKVVALSTAADCIRVNNGSSFVFDQNRFNLVVPPVPEPNFKVGDTVRFIGTSYYITMTKGREYTVTNVINYEGCKQNVNTLNNNGNDACWPGIFFELVEPPVPKPSTYTVTWVAPRKEGYTSLIDGELSFGTADEAYGFSDLFCSDVDTKVTKD